MRGRPVYRKPSAILGKDEAFIKNMDIAEYDKGSYNNHEPRRDRKLLLKKREIRKIRKSLEEKGTDLNSLEAVFQRTQPGQTRS